MRTSTVNLCWAIGVLLAINAGLILYLPAGADVANFISFAAAIASLVLAIVAIVYSMVSNKSFVENIGILNRSADKAEAATQRVLDASVRFDEQSANIFEQLSVMTPEIQKVSGKVDQLFSAVEGGSSKESARDVDRSASELTLGPHTLNSVVVAFYAMVLSFENGRPLDVKVAIDLDSWRWSVMGVYAYIISFGVLGIEIEREGASFTVLSLGSLDAVAVKEVAERRAVDTLESGRPGIGKYKKSIDAYFSVEDESAEVLPQ